MGHTSFSPFLSTNIYYRLKTTESFTLLLICCAKKILSKRLSLTWCRPEFKYCSNIEARAQVEGPQVKCICRKGLKITPQKEGKVRNGCFLKKCFLFSVASNKGIIKTSHHRKVRSGRQADRQASRQTDRQTLRQSDRRNRWAEASGKNVIEENPGSPPLSSMNHFTFDRFTELSRFLSNLSSCSAT
jgi:hypothetical protein